MGDPLDDAVRDVMRLLNMEPKEPVRKGVRNPVVEQREAGGHIGEWQTEELELPSSVRRMLGTQTPPHLLTVRRTR